jgi:hypothetical protein
MKALRPANVRMPPMIHKKSETPTEPEAAKTPEGVLKIPVDIGQSTVS